MATEPGFVEYVQTQSGLGRELSFRKMFGEYALYLRGKVVAFACDNQLYVTPTEAGARLLGKRPEHPAYPGGKPYFRIDDEMEDRALLARLLETTADALPLPKPKIKAKTKATAAPTAISTARRPVTPARAAPRKPRGSP